MTEGSLREKLNNMSDEELAAAFATSAEDDADEPCIDFGRFKETCDRLCQTGSAYLKKLYYVLPKAGAAAGMLGGRLANGDTGKAAIAYCFLAIDRELDERTGRLFDEFFSLKQYANRYLLRKGLIPAGENLPDGDEAIVEFCRGRGVKNIVKYFPGGGCGDFDGRRGRIIAECEQYLSQAEEDETRYERAAELIRSMDGGISNFAVLVWNLVSTGIYEGIYEGNRKKLVRFLIRYTKRDKSALAEMEETARTMAALDEKRAAIQREGASDTYEHTSARLAELRVEEKTAKKRLKELIGRDLFEKREKTEEDEEEACEEYSTGEGIVDTIGDGIVRGIETVTNILCAPFEFLTEKISGL